jgi:hypothetical protein
VAPTAGQPSATAPTGAFNARPPGLNNRLKDGVDILDALPKSLISSLASEDLPAGQEDVEHWILLTTAELGADTVKQTRFEREPSGARRLNIIEHPLRLRMKFKVQMLERIIREPL